VWKLPVVICRTNWRAEHALRPAVVAHKVCGGNRSDCGAHTHSFSLSGLGSRQRIWNRRPRSGTTFASSLHTQPANGARPTLSRRRDDVFATRIANSNCLLMNAWVQYRRGRVWYTGRIARAPFVAWLAMPEGRATVDEAALHGRFAFFARARAERRLWRRLVAAARNRDVVAAIQREMDAYLGRLQEFAYADGLPRLSVDLHRIVVVPRVLINGAAYGAIARRLRSEPAFASLDGGDALRDFFIRTLIDHLDGAIAGTMPSPKRPLAVGDEWISIGLDGAFVWRVPLLNEPPWDGHHYVLELTRDPITRAVRKAVAVAVERIQASLPSLSRVERNEILRRAVRGA
jgi:hypothetical protein